MIIIESNVNDIVYPEAFYTRDIIWLYQTLYNLNKKILVLILPCPNKKCNYIHKIQAKKYNFNILDMQTYYEKYNLLEFKHRNGEWYHQFPFILRILGLNIMDNFYNFLIPRKISNSIKLPNFKIINFNNLEKKLFQILHFKNNIFALKKT